MSNNVVLNNDIEDEEFCWNAFVSWCEGEGINLEDKEDWVVWWNCWCEGILAYLYRPITE